MSRRATVRRDAAGKVGHGLAGEGEARQGKFRCVTAGFGQLRCVQARYGRLG